MDLWIRSQDKQELIKVNEVCINKNNECLICANYHVIDSYNDFEYKELGEYATKERTLEILNDIQNMLLPTSITKKKFKEDQKKEEDKNKNQENNSDLLLEIKSSDSIEKLDSTVVYGPLNCCVYIMPEK